VTCPRPGRNSTKQAPGPSLLDPKVSVRTVASGLVTPTSMAFLGADDMLVLEKQTGKVQRVTGGTVQTVDVAVNNASERGLLGIALQQVGANMQKIFAYGVRNSFGLAFDPVSGRLWDEQNGDDSFDELNQVERRSNLGWVRMMGPVSRCGGRAS